MKAPRRYFDPLAIGAPRPLLELPSRLEHMIHFIPPHNEKVRAKAAELVGQVDVILGNLEDAIPIEAKLAARDGLIAMEGDRVGLDRAVGARHALNSPWFIDDMTRLVGEIGDKLDVVMVPKIEGDWDIHFLDQYLALLEARHGLKRPILVHAILETAQGVNKVEAIAAASPRMQGMSLGPADLAASRAMKTTRVGGGHPDYRVLADSAKPTPTARAPSRILGITPSPVWSTLAQRTASSPSMDRSAISPTPPVARRNSATPSSSAAWAHGPSTRARSRSPKRCFRQIRAKSPSQARFWLRCQTDRARR